MRHLSRLAVPLLLGALPLGASGQDVEMLGLRYGTRPPATYYEEMGRDEIAFQFSRARALRPETRRPSRARLRSGPALDLGPRDGPVVGTFRVPVLLGLYSNTVGPPPFTRGTIETSYFGGQPGTITDYYSEVSAGRVSLLGDVFDWDRISQTDSIITGGDSGLFYGPLGGAGAGNFVYEIVALQTGADWGLYDNDGPDGIPNSGDDDGFVDVVAVLHPTVGGECGGAAGDYRIWSHRWSLSAAVGQTLETSTPSANGGFIRVDDYVIQPSVACTGGQLSQIGVFTHELGHAFGLPDLYDTETSGGRHSGAGNWDLMSSGSWGCNNVSPASPCHMGAWSKEQLGWADVVTLAPDTDHGTLTLPPIETDGTIYRIDANDGSGEYFLLENRQRIGYDQNLFHPGLLIWHIDPDWVAARWGSNTVNADAHRGVWLRQADGLDELGQAGGGRGDASDPFPGFTGNTSFHAASLPAATSYLGGPTGLTVVDITESGDDVQFRLLTRFTTITVSAVGSSSPDGLFTINGAQVDPPQTTLSSAPFVEHSIEAVSGEAVAPGERRPFLEWTDDPGAERVRAFVTPLSDAVIVAEYGGSEFELDLSTLGAVNQIAPATFTSTPASTDLWFADGTDVTLAATPITGYGFVGWTGDLTGQPNPASFTMTGPLAAGAEFELEVAVATNEVDLEAAAAVELQLAVENGSPPYTWRLLDGTMPVGLRLSGTGRITGASLDYGSFPLTLEALDAIGLPASGTVTLEIAAPDMPIEQLASPFLLSGPPLEPAQLGFLNQQGNGVSGYDIGDFRAWVLANPSLPLSADMRTLLGPRTIRLQMKTEQPREDGR